ncbi:MAG TPA: hypothetical protein EYO90_05695 [Candidatus Latescibacteria bacterium]|nr:hypothetical protein [Candidatus Latescibacterota bacterium]
MWPTSARSEWPVTPAIPWLPPGYRGVDRVLGGAQGFKRFIEICPSDYCGLNLCFGCMAESSTDPANEVPEIIHYFGSRSKIFLCHFRNIVGRAQQVPGSVAGRGGHEHAPQHAGFAGGRSPCACLTTRPGTRIRRRGARPSPGSSVTLRR